MKFRYIFYFKEFKFNIFYLSRVFILLGKGFVLCYWVMEEVDNDIVVQSTVSF